MITIAEELGGVRVPKADWSRLVLERSGGICGNCGAGEVARLKVRMIVPVSAGGEYRVSNGILLCRACEMAWDIQGGPVSEAKRPVNLWIGTQLHQVLLERMGRIAKRKGHSSMSALVRYLVGMYVLDEERFDDLEQYQDEGSDVKINLWLHTYDYECFKEMLDRRGMTVTAAIKGLILMYATGVRT